MTVMKYLFIGAALILHGCGSEDKGEVIHKQGDQEIAVKESGDSVAVTVKGEQGTAEFSSGAGVEMPKGFPSDVPTYPGMKLDYSGTQGGMFTINGRTPDALARVSDSLKSKVADNGWTETMSMSQPGGGGEPGIMMSYMKDNRILNVVLSTQGEETQISIMTGGQ